MLSYLFVLSFVGLFINSCSLLMTQIHFYTLIKRRSAGELEHLKEVKDHYGNVEIDSITQATAINQTGKYYVGNIPEYSRQFKVGFAKY